MVSTIFKMREGLLYYPTTGRPLESWQQEHNDRVAGYQEEEVRGSFASNFRRDLRLLGVEVGNEKIWNFDDKPDLVSFALHCARGIPPKQSVEEFAEQYGLPFHEHRYDYNNNAVLKDRIKQAENISWRLTNIDTHVHDMVLAAPLAKDTEYPSMNYIHAANEFGPPLASALMSHQLGKQKKQEDKQNIYALANKIVAAPAQVAGQLVVKAIQELSRDGINGLSLRSCAALLAQSFPDVPATKRPLTRYKLHLRHEMKASAADLELVDRLSDQLNAVRPTLEPLLISEGFTKSLSQHR